MGKKSFDLLQTSFRKNATTCKGCYKLPLLSFLHKGKTILPIILSCCKLFLQIIMWLYWLCLAFLILRKITPFVQKVYYSAKRLFCVTLETSTKRLCVVTFSTLKSRGTHFQREKAFNFQKSFYYNKTLLNIESKFIPDGVA